MLKRFARDFRKHHNHYFILFAGIGLGFVSYFAFSGFSLLRILSIIWLGVFYTAWGTVHHLVLRDWHIKVTLEYLLIAIIGCGILLSIII